MSQKAEDNTSCAKQQTLRESRYRMRFLKPLLGTAVLVGLLSFTDTDLLISQFQKTNLSLFGLALILAVTANIMCAWRWQIIASQLGISAPFFRFLSLYAQGICANSVLPGGIVGGDALRSLAISEYTKTNAKHDGVLSVLLDRVSGFWGLAWLSLFSGLVFFITGRQVSEPSGWLDTSYVRGYLLALIVIATTPMIGRLMHLVWIKRYESRDRHFILQLLIKIINGLPVLLRTLPHSFVIQLVTASSFWLCLLSVQVDIPFWLLVAMSGGIFLSGALPASLGGFGARELGALSLLAPFGFSKEGVFAASLLFGLISTIQGLFGLLFWLHTRGNRRCGSEPRKNFVAK
jgi:uncharacterized protein (TIRG00374 family)